MATFPTLLAAGVTNEGAFLPFELFAGEAPVLTSHGTAAGTALAQFSIVSRNEDGLLVAWSETAGRATLAGTFSAVGTADDTITINGQAFVLKAAAASTYEVTIGGTATITATNLTAKINAVPDVVNVTATSAGAVVTLFARVPGYGGNSITVSEAGTGFSWAGAATTLAGGADESEGIAIGIVAQAIAAAGMGPIYTGGCFNHEVLVWPASLTTLAQRRAVFDRSPISLDVPRGAAGAMTYPP